jgi:hypothetical protein
MKEILLNGPSILNISFRSHILLSFYLFWNWNNGNIFLDHLVNQTVLAFLHSNQTK